ncbi:hypothetical protein ZWY2020_025802 [Hordeum vulgare]|nr:hypothetical protein ZWY2020_025802 [Hordeum vulgare]
MGKRRRQECDCGKRRRKHLYLVLDDWDNGFSLHKMDALSLLDDSDDDGGRELERLPDPPAVRITEARQSPMLFAGLGTSIFVANKIQRSPKVTGALVYDTETAAIAMGPAPGEHMLLLRRRQPQRNQGRSCIRWEKHTTATDQSTRGGTWWAYPSTRCHGRAPPPHWPSHGSPATSGPGRASPRPRRRSTATRNRRLLRGARTGTPYSSRRKTGSGDPPAPIPSTRSGGSGGRTGNGCCLSSGGATSKGRSTHGSGSTRTATSAAAGPPRPRREQRRVEEDGQKLYREGDRDRRLGATLTYMGNNVFCLVESVVREDVDPGRAYGGGRGCALHVTVFGLKYNREGEVQATLRRVTKSYAVSKYIPDFTHEAFWM